MAFQLDSAHSPSATPLNSNNEAAVHTPNLSPAQQVFNTYELVEMILLELDFPTTIRVQLINQMCHAVTLQSTDIGKDWILPTWMYPLSLFTTSDNVGLIDTHRQMRYYLRDMPIAPSGLVALMKPYQKPWCIRKEDRYKLLLPVLSGRFGRHTRTIHAGTNSAASGLWRRLRFASGYKTISLILCRPEIAYRSGRYSTVFEGDCTLGEVYDRLCDIERREL